jgi:hypothetical protein
MVGSEKVVVVVAGRSCVWDEGQEEKEREDHLGIKYHEEERFVRLTIGRGGAWGSRASEQNLGRLTEPKRTSFFCTVCVLQYSSWHRLFPPVALAPGPSPGPVFVWNFSSTQTS